MDSQEQAGEEYGKEDAQNMLSGGWSVATLAIIDAARQAQKRDLYSRGYVRGFESVLQ